MTEKSISLHKSCRPYNHRWRKARLIFLQKNPLCVFCKKAGIIQAAEVVDHIVPHKGNSALFWDSAKNWQPLCKQCHDITKQRIEQSNIIETGLDGYAANSSNLAQDEDEAHLMRHGKPKSIKAAVKSKKRKE